MEVAVFADESDDIDCCCGGGKEGMIEGDAAMEAEEWVDNFLILAEIGMVSFIEDDVDDDEVAVFKFFTNPGGDCFVGDKDNGLGLSFIELATE